MKRTIRLDDYPYGTPGMDVVQCRQTVADACAIFNAAGVPFMLGVSPMLIDHNDIVILNTVLPPYGKAVMHGFTHGFDMGDAVWQRIVDTWPLGGEFMFCEGELLRRRYWTCDFIMQSLTAYDKRHFIAPFNSYTQNLVDVLEQNGVEYLHTTDVAWKSYGLHKITHRSIQPVLAVEGMTYDFVDTVIANYGKIPAQITLHWSMDAQEVDNWQDKYRQLCHLINEEAMA
jgi:hypothetical protein